MTLFNLLVLLQTQATLTRPFFYKNGNLNLEADFFKLTVKGLFPYHLQSWIRTGNEHKEEPCSFVASMLAKQGYAVIVRSRRGYGKSDDLPMAMKLDQISLRSDASI